MKIRDGDVPVASPGSKDLARNGNLHSRRQSCQRRVRCLGREDQKEVSLHWLAVAVSARESAQAMWHADRS